MSSLNIAVIIGSTRPNRFSEKPAQWIFEEAKKKADWHVELIDLRDWPLPFYDQPKSPSGVQDGNYPTELATKFAAKIASFDAFIIVSPEYNHSFSAVLKNALDTIYKEWNNKAVCFVSYGSVAGARAIEHLRLVAIELQMAPIRQSIHIPGSYPFGQTPWEPASDASLMRAADTMLTQLEWWAHALKNARG